MFMREQVNLWLQRNATPFTPDDTMRQEVTTYLTGVRDELDDDETSPARPDGLQRKRQNSEHKAIIGLISPSCAASRDKKSRQ